MILERVLTAEHLNRKIFDYVSDAVVQYAFNSKNITKTEVSKHDSMPQHIDFRNSITESCPSRVFAVSVMTLSSATD